MPLKDKVELMPSAKVMSKIGNGYKIGNGVGAKHLLLGPRNVWIVYQEADWRAGYIVAGKCFALRLTTLWNSAPAGTTPPPHNLATLFSHHRLGIFSTPMGAIRVL